MSQQFNDWDIEFSQLAAAARGMTSRRTLRQLHTRDLLDCHRAHYGSERQGCGNHPRQQTALCRYYETCVHLNVSLYSKVAHCVMGAPPGISETGAQ